MWRVFMPLIWMTKVRRKVNDMKKSVKILLVALGVAIVVHVVAICVFMSNIRIIY